MMMRVGRDRDHLGDDVGHDLEVGVEQVVAAHAGLARDARGDDDDIGVGGVGVVVGAGDGAVALLDRHGLHQVERLALGDALHDVDQHHVRQFLRRDPVRSRRPYISRANNRYLLPHPIRLLVLILRRTRPPFIIRC